MKGFFDQFKNGGDKPSMKNLFQSSGGQRFKGEGKSLGGLLPGKVIQVILGKPGALGMKVERRPNSQGTAIVAMVVPGGQAEEAGLQRGDVLCFAGSNGQEEIMYDQFLAMAASDMRPLVLDVRRIETKGAASSGNTAIPTATKASAEDYARRQAVIAAAEARERAHKAKTKPIPKANKDALPLLLSTAEKRRLEQERQERARQDIIAEPRSEEAKKAMQAAKADEAALAAQLGYNPYEPSRATAGQARNATVALAHGTINADAERAPHLPVVRQPLEIPAAVSDGEGPTSLSSHAFEDAYTTVVTTNSHEVVVTSLGIMRKLIVNAITKGQEKGDDSTAAKFRRVRLGNPKINESIAQVHGAMDLMLAVGFQLLQEEEGEVCLVYPPNQPSPTWLSGTLKRMEQYENS